MIEVHGRPVRAVVARHESNFADAEEVFGDVFLLAYERLDIVSTLEPRAQLSWLLRTARHLIANRARRNITRRKALELARQEPVPPMAGPEDEYFLAEEREAAAASGEAVRETLAQLKPADRQILIMDALEWTGNQIADAFGISRSGALTRKSRARAVFREHFAFRSYADDDRAAVRLRRAEADG